MEKYTAFIYRCKCALCLTLSFLSLQAGIDFFFWYWPWLLKRRKCQTRQIRNKPDWGERWPFCYCMNLALDCYFSISIERVIYGSFFFILYVSRVNYQNNCFPIDVNFVLVCQTFWWHTINFHGIWREENCVTMTDDIFMWYFHELRMRMTSSWSTFLNILYECYRVKNILMYY